MDTSKGRPVPVSINDLILGSLVWFFLCLSCLLVQLPPYYNFYVVYTFMYAIVSNKYVDDIIMVTVFWNKQLLFLFQEAKKRYEKMTKQYCACLEKNLGVKPAKVPENQIQEVSDLHLLLCYAIIAPQGSGDLLLSLIANWEVLIDGLM